MNRGDNFRRFKVVNELSGLLYALLGCQHHYTPPIEVSEASNGQLVCFVDEDKIVKPPLHPFKVVDGHTLQSIDLRTCK